MQFLRAAPLVPIALLACAEPAREPPPAAHALDLLARTPDAIADQPGELLPGTGEWDEHAYDGWQSLGDESRRAWAVARSASVRLPLVVLGETEVELELVGPGMESTVGVKWNEQSLGTVRVGPEPSRHALTIPADACLRGDNVLSLEGDALGRVADTDVFFGLDGVRYGGARRLRVARASGALEVPPDCSVAYRLEVLADTTLVVGGRAAARGALGLSLRRVDPATGALESLAAEAHETSAGPVELRIALPRLADVLEVELAWSSPDPAAKLALERLVLEERERSPRPPVLFVSIDTLSAQHLSLYGYPRATTPHLEELARDAVVFRSCRANAPWTIPSYMSQFTGLYPRAHTLTPALGAGRIDFTPWETQQVAPSRWTLAELFRASGYATAGFVDNPWLAKGFGFRQGFDHYDTAASEVALDDPAGGFASIVARAFEWLDARREGEPFFLFLQAFDTHAPYHARSPWKGRFDEDALVDPEWEVPAGPRQAFAYGCVPGHIAWSLRPGPAMPERMRVAPIANAYDEKIAEVDAALGALVAGLKERGLYDSLAIVFSADHGESTVNHDFFFNHALLYGDVLHVPLVVKLPGQAHAGTSVESLVELVDLYPTLLELVRPGADRALHGRSLLPLARGEREDERPSFGEGEFMQELAVEHEGWKLIETNPLYGPLQTQLTHPRLDRARLGQICAELASGWFTDSEIAAILARNPAARRFLDESLAGPIHELYYLPDDPRELHDLAAEHPERVAELRAYGERMRALGEHARSQARLVTPPVTLDADDLDAMRALGYVGD